jgi:hypothetical protein
MMWMTTFRSDNELWAPYYTARFVLQHKSAMGRSPNFLQTMKR